MQCMYNSVCESVGHLQIWGLNIMKIWNIYLGIYSLLETSLKNHQKPIYLYLLPLPLLRHSKKMKRWNVGPSHKVPKIHQA